MKTALKILIVENDTISCLLLCHYLKFFGFCNCLLAATAEDALRIAEEERPDVILTEIILSGETSGIETAKQIMKKDDNAVIAFMTSCDDPKVMQEALKISPAGYFVKPLKINVIRELLESINAGCCLPAFSIDEPYGILRGLNYEKK